MTYSRILRVAAIFALIGLSRGITAQAATATAPVPSYRAEVPDVSGAVDVGRYANTQQITATLTLPLRNESRLDALLEGQSNPISPEYDRFLSPAEFEARFCPTQAEYSAVEAFVRAAGLSVVGAHSNRLLLDISGTRDVFESAFGVHLNWYEDAKGRIFYGPDALPSIPAALAGDVSGVVGLSDSAVRHPFLVERDNSARFPDLTAGPGTGPQGGLAPNDIRAAYSLGSVPLNGAGQTLAVFELDGYTASDISAYESGFGLANVPIQNVLVDGASGVPGSGASEVTLDIEMTLSLAFGASKIIVYETQNSDTGILDGYSRIADDDAAREVSTSWGLDEPDNSTAFMESENSIFKQMAAQGQSVFAASGDYGAYDAGSIARGLCVDDPGSQPYVCCAGGTSLTTATPGGPWKSETTWNAGSVQAGAGGGGASSLWPIPSWQKAAITISSGASKTMRNVPDISINADPNVGYSIYYAGAWTVFGGTSCSAPLWAGFTALVNQQRALNGLPALGQASPALYPLLSKPTYTSYYHDIADDSNNFYYNAVAGYDDATGLGTPDGAALLTALSEAPPAAPQNLKAAPGNQDVTLTWSAVKFAVSYDIYRSQTSGSGYVKIGSSAATTFKDTGVTNGKTYYYVVSSVNTVAQSAYSNQVSATPNNSIATFPAGINFISLPYSYGSTPLSSLFGYSNPIMALWDPSIGSYLLTPDEPLNHIYLGDGYWVRFPEPVTVTMVGTPASTAGKFAVNLAAGWNQIGNPFPASVSLNRITVVGKGKSYTYAGAISAGLLGAIIYPYNTATASYEAISDSGSLQPDAGYFLYAASSVTLEISPPY